jgi:hypothetical protein
VTINRAEEDKCIQWEREDDGVFGKTYTEMSSYFYFKKGGTLFSGEC